MSKKKLLLILFLSVHFKILNLAEWTILIVMQGDNNLSYFMHQNINIMKSIGSDHDVNLAIQWDEPFKHKTWRYKVGLKRLEDCATLNKDMGKNPSKELVEAATWAFKKYPAKKKALILWNHGSGILDEEQNWNHNRGILYDFSSNKCLTNQGLFDALAIIKNKTLEGKNLDLIGMDACLMAMVEVAYQIKDFANIFVASENIQYTPGWHYASILNQLKLYPKNYDSISLGHLIVRSFEKFNKNRNNVFTQSVMDLSITTSLKNSIATIANSCLEGKEKKILNKIIKQARKDCVEFDRGRYIDLFNFYNLFSEKLRTCKQISPELKNNLLLQIKHGTYVLKKFVLGHVKGQSYGQTYGLSIYFPRKKKLHDSYYSTLFAKETQWPLFISTFSQS